MIDKKIIFFCLFFCFVLFSCEKEKKLMRMESGVWEIKKWQGITYKNGVVVKDTSIADMGYFALSDNSLNSQNDVHYNLTYSPPSWGDIVNPDTQLDPYNDVCWWESDTFSNDRISFEELGDYTLNVMMFTISKSGKNHQEWVYITHSDSTASTMGAKEIFTLERATH